MSAELLIRRHEFDQGGLFPVQAGQTLQQMLEQAAGGQALPTDLVVRVGGHEVPVALWTRVRPKVGTAIIVTRTGLAGGSARRLLAAVAMIVVSIYAPGWGASIASSMGWGATAGQVIAAGIVMAASYAVNALVRVPVPGADGGADAGRWNALTGASNQINPWGVIPIVLGEHRHYPVHAAMPYSRSAGTDSYHHYLFDLGFGELEVSDIRIGDTPIDSFEDVQYEVTTSPTLYLNDVNELAVAATLGDGDDATRTTSPNSEEIGIDLLFPVGFFGIGSSGQLLQAECFFGIEYRLVGDSTWTQLTADEVSSPRQSLTAIAYTIEPQYDQVPYVCRRDNRKPFTASVSWAVPAGQYEVRVKRGTSEWGSATESSRAGTQCTWTILRSIRSTNPSTTGTNKLAMRIRASDQLNGTLQTLSCLIKQKIPVYDRDTGTWSLPEICTNPAWVAHWVMTACPAMARRVPATRIDLDSFADFADYCDAHDFETRMVVDTPLTAADLLRKILGGALGDLGNRDGKYCVIYDRDDPTPVAVLTPLETTDIRHQRAFTRYPHALRVQFRNPEAGWKDDEIIVVRDGYTYRGKNARGEDSGEPAATEFETLPLQQTMYAEQAWKLGRYHFAQALFRPNVLEWSSDIAGLGVTRGDVVQVPNDVVEWGDGWGRVVSLTAGGPSAATLVLDAALGLNPAKSYRFQFRTAAGGLVTANVYAAADYTSVFYLTSMPDGVQPGDVAALGDVSAEIKSLIVTAVRYTNDLGTHFIGTDYDDRVAAYWADPPDTFHSEVTGTDLGAPPAPAVTIAVSFELGDDRDDAGIASPVVTIVLDAPNGRYLPVVTTGDTHTGATQIVATEVRWRSSSELIVMPWTYQSFAAGEAIALRDLNRDTEYTIEVRNIAANGRASDWVTNTVEVPASNRTGTLALPTNVAGRAGVWDVDTTVEYSATDSSADIDVSAGTLVIDGRSIEYGASSVTVSGAPLAEKVFWLYYVDPQLQGGTLTLHATEDYTEAIGGSGNVIIAPVDIEFPDTGGSSSGSGGVGGGGTVPPACPWVEAFVEEQALGFVRIGDMRFGHVIRLWNGEWGKVTSARNRWRPGYRITTERGIELTCSDTAPIRVPGGRMQARSLAPGMALYAHDGDWDGVDAVAGVEFLGIIEVMELQVQRTFYRVGNAAGRALDHHNIYKDPTGL